MVEDILKPEDLVKPRRRWVRPVVAVVLLALLVGGGWLWHTRRQKSDAPEIRTREVSRGSLVQSISTTGKIAAETGAYVKIGSQITGRIRRLYADLGSEVQAGQVIAELDAPDLEASLQVTQRSLAQAEARYQQQLEGVPVQHTQLTSAFEQASASLQRAQAQREQARASFAAAESRLRSAISAVTSAQAREKSAEAQLRAAQATAERQPVQTSTEVARAQAALDTAQANLRQAQKTSELQVSSAQAALRQAQASAELAATTLQRQEALLEKGFIAPQDVDSARTQREVSRRQVETAQANLDLTREKVVLDVQATRDAVSSAEAALTSARAGSYQEIVSTEAVRSAEASLAEARTAISQAQNSVESARADLASAEAQVNAVESEIRSARAAQQAALGNLTQDRVKQQEVKAAYEAMLQARAQVDLQRAQFDKSYIRTPVSGTVVTLAQQEGETVAAGLAAPTLIEVVDLDRLEVHAYVDETDIGKVQIGQTASIIVDAYPDHGLQGKVEKIASAATIEQNVVTYMVTVSMEEYSRDLLKPEMTTSVTIDLERRDDVLVVPNEAVKQRREGTQIVVLVNGQGEVRSVTTGLSDGESTEIIEGVQEGEQVVIAGYTRLGLPEFAAGAGVPRFLQRSPLGVGGPTGGGRR